MGRPNMKTRNGKIARLPLDIREQLNARLSDGEPGNRLVEWLNSIPDVIKVMAEQFDGRPINENNISEWRQGGYEEWATLRSFLDETHILSENAGQISDTGISSEHLHMVLLAYHAHLLQNFEIMPEAAFKLKVDALKKLTASLMNMRRAELQEARMELQRERLELLREKQSLQSVSSSKAVVSTSRNAHPDASETRPTTASCASPSGSDIPSTSDSCSAESAAPPLSAPASKSAPGAPILSGRIKPEFPPRVTHSPLHPRFPKSDPLGFTVTQACKIAA
jgi:hypothetical protein